MKKIQPSEQLTLPLGEQLKKNEFENSDSAPKADNVVSFNLGLKLFNESQKADALRRVLSLREEIREG